MVRLATVVLLLPLSGCATTWTLFEVAGLDWHQGSTWRETPTGPRERRAAIRLDYVSNPEPPPAPPEPEPAAQTEAPPEPSAPPLPEPGAADAEATGLARCSSCPAPHPAPPPLPLPRGGLKLVCEEQARWATVHVDRELYRYDGVWKALTVFAFLAEAGFTALAATQVADSGRTGKSPAPWIGLGAFTALDAVGTAVLFFHRPETLYRSEDGPGMWKTEAPHCAGLTLEVAGGEVPVSPDGALYGWEPWLLQTALAGLDTRVFTRVGGQRVELNPEPVDRCTWARAAGVEHPACRAFVVGFSGQATLVPLPGDAPTRAQVLR